MNLRLLPRTCAIVFAAMLVVAACDIGTSESTTAPSASQSPGQATPSPTPTQTPALPPKHGGVLRTWAFATPESFDLLAHKDPDSWATVLPMMNWLVANDQGGRGLVPELAERWTASGTQYVFSLNRKARFHDGSPLVADDVIASLRRVADTPSAPYRRPLQNVTRMDALDPYTVRVTLKAPDPTFVAGLGAIGNVIFLSFRQPDQAQRFAPVGTGPFRLKRFVPGVSVDLERNSTYFLAGADGLPYLDDIQVLALGEAETGIAAMISGEVDLSPPLPLSALGSSSDKVMRVLKRFPLATFQGATETLTFANAGKWTDQRLRQAIALRIDRDAFNRDAAYGLGNRNAWLLPARETGGSWALPATSLQALLGYGDQKTEGARGVELLRVADGWPGNARLVASEDQRAAAESLMTQLAPIAGNGLRLDVLNAVDYASARVTRSFDLLLDTTSTYLDDPSIALDDLFRSDAPGNLGRWQSADIDRLLAAMGRETDTVRRQSFAGDLQRRLIDLSWVVAIGTVPYARIAVSAVQSVPRSLLLEDGPSWRLDRVWLNRG